MGRFPDYSSELLSDQSCIQACPAPPAPSAQFSPAHLSPEDWTSYHDRFCANIGGGAYPRVLALTQDARLYRVRKQCADGEFATITQALAQWEADKRLAAAPHSAIIDIADSATYHEAPHFQLEPGEQLQLRAANMARPVLRMFDYGSGVPDQIRVAGAPGSRLTLDGLLVAGGGIEVDSASAERCLVTLRHCTLVPGWDQDGVSRAPWRAKPSVTLRGAGVALRVDHSIVGPIRVDGNAGLPLHVGDSIIDAGHDMGLAVSDAQYGPAQVSATFERSTVIGLVQVEQIALAENAIFLGPLLAVRRDAGSVRFCYVAPGSRTPRRDYCQPDLNERVRPRYEALRYGVPGYGQLAPDCAIEISCGADDDAAMGAFHDQRQPSAAAHAASPQA